MAVHRTASHRKAVQCKALHSTAPHCNAKHSIAAQSNAEKSKVKIRSANNWPDLFNARQRKA